MFPLPLIGGSADSEGTAGVMLTIIIKYFCDDKYFSSHSTIIFLSLSIVNIANVCQY